MDTSASFTDRGTISPSASAEATSSTQSGLGRVIGAIGSKFGWWDLFFLGMLVLLGMKVNWGVGVVHDVHIADETSYLSHGVEFDLSRPQMSPLYSGWYYLLSLVEPDRLELYFLSWFLLPLGMAIGVYMLIRSLGGAGGLAFASAAIVLLSRVSDVTPRPMHFAVCLLLMGLAIAFALRPMVARLAVATLTVGVAAFARPEFAVSFIPIVIVFVAALAWRGFRRPEEIGRLAAVGLLTLLPVMTLYQVIGNPLGGGRSEIAFCQHYGYNKFLAGLREKGALAWHNFLPVVEKDFGEAPIGIVGAMKASPGHFAWHVSQNIKWLYSNFRDILVSLSDTVTYLLWGYVALLLAAAAVVVFARVRKMAWRRLAADAGLPMLVALAVLAPVIAGCLLIHPREHYLVCLLGVLLVAATAVLGTISIPWRPQAWQGAGAIVAALIFFYAPNNHVGWDYHKLVSESDREEFADKKHLTRLAKFIREIPFRGEIHVMENGFSRFAYGDNEFKSYMPTHVGPQGFVAFLKKRDINTVVLSPHNRRYPYLKNDPDFQQFQVDPPPGWVLIGRPDIPVQFAVRRDVLEAGRIDNVIATPLKHAKWR